MPKDKLPIAKSYSRGLVIGRFQPFHLGHKFLIEQALKTSEKIIIGIGSSNVHDDNNPYSYALRKKIVKHFVKSEGIEHRVHEIVSVVDHPDDEVWLKKLLIKTGKLDSVIGDNEWVNGIFENFGVQIIRTGFLDRERLEGKVIRQLMKENKKWEDRVLPYVVTLLEK